ncbi:TrbI/VirB10 family protein [Paracraurococcus lichenis]|uniref:TrbI/VirB10 family protein n=1 Tax=Paracraurococcus lichenis TaxID=3064888 RepID=A0ABT9E6H4_9PROT|nr:TrbI/VirB10 family protein [Paracraurococcus sp. LOR1-02]MDO9711776.1 TrbI/VirB10 family protein [Paracraurococcus sp. LOR1-02]
MSDERGAPVRLGRFGRPVRAGMGVALLLVTGAAVIAFALRGELNPEIRPPQSEAGADTITPGAAISQPVMPPVQPAVMAVPQPQPAPATPVMPSNTALLPQGPAQGPRRVTSFAAKAQPAAQPASASAAGVPATPPPTATAPGQASVGGPPGPTTVAFAGSAMPGLRAGPAIDLTFVMQPGLYRLVLAAPINSERSGTFFGLLPEAIRSPAGVVLMERGSRLWGAYKSEVGPGQERIVSAAAWGLTPNGVPVPLGEAAVTDGSGRAGMPGTVNTHFWARFGGAITLMVTQGAFQAASAALQASLTRGSGNSFVNLNTSSLDAALAATLRNNLNIQNTVDVPAGTEIAFMLNQPIDFADAYRLAPTGAR